MSKLLEKLFRSNTERKRTRKRRTFSHVFEMLEERRLLTSGLMANDDNGSDFATFENTAFTTGSVLDNDTDDGGANPTELVAYVANADDDTVSVLSMDTMQTLDTVSVGDNPRRLAISPDGASIYVVNWDSANVTVIDTASNAIVENIPVGIRPRNLVVDRDGSKIYVTNSGSSSISVIDIATNSVVDTISTPANPESIAFHPVRDEIWLGTGSRSQVLQVLSAQDYSLIANLSSFAPLYATTGIAFSPDGSELFGVENCGLCGRFHRLSGDPTGGSIRVLQQNIRYDYQGAAEDAIVHPVTGVAYLAKRGQTGPHRLVEFGGAGRTLTFDGAPSKLELSEDGSLLYVNVWTLNSPGYVAVVDVATFAVVDTIGVGKRPEGLLLSQRPTGSELFVESIDITGTSGLVTDNGDGTFTYDPGRAFDYLAAGEHKIDQFEYTVSNGRGETDTAIVTISIAGANDLPKITMLASDAPSDAPRPVGEPINVTGDFQDIDLSDDHDVIVDWGDGSSSEAVVNKSGIAHNFTDSHIYHHSGSHVITVAITDSSGGVATSTATASVGEIAVDDDGVLNIVGTAGADFFYLSPAGQSMLSIIYRLDNGGTQQKYVDTTRVNRLRVHLGSMNDQFYGSRLTLPVEVNGGEGDDTIQTGTNDDVVHGGDGHNRIHAGEGNNTVFGGSGVDDITTGSGNDTIAAGDGKNRISSGSGNDSITTGSDNDVIRSGDGTNTINAGAGDNVITAQGHNFVTALGGDDKISTGSGNDTIDAGDGTNTINAGNGNNSIRTAAGNDRIYAYYGDDMVDAGDGDNYISVGNGDNTVTAADGSNRVYSGNGNDMIDVAGGNNWISAGNGTNVISVADGNNHINGGWGSDHVTTGHGNNQIEVSHGLNVVLVGNGDNNIRSGNDADHIDVGEGINVVDSGGGDDRVVVASGSTAANRLSGGAGNDVLIGGGGSDTLRGSDGDDVLIGGGGNDDLDGGNGADILSGGDGDDLLYGGYGANVLIGGRDSDRLYGHSGQDILIAGGTDHDDHEAALVNILREWSSVGDFDARVANLLTGGGLAAGTELNDYTIFGDSAIDRLYGRGNRDWFWAEDSVDILSDLDTSSNGDHDILDYEFDYFGGTPL